MDRALGFGPRGWGFESSRAHERILNQKYEWNYDEKQNYYNLDRNFDCRICVNHLNGSDQKKEIILKLMEKVIEF